MRAPGLRSIPLVFLAAAVALAGCSLLRSSRPGEPPAELPESAPYMIVTAAVDGEALDCGCKSGPKGGLARRKTFIDTLSAERGWPLLVDGGDFLAAASRAAERERAALIFEALGETGYGLATFGENELSYGWSFLRPLAAEHGVEFICANVFDAGTGEPLVPAFTLRKMGEHRVAFFGALSPSLPITPLDVGTPAPEVRDPVAIAKELVPRLRREAEVVVGLLHMPAAEVKSFAREVEGIDLVVFGHDPSRVRDYDPVEGTRTIGVRVGARGRHVGVVEIDRDGAGRPVFGGRLWELDASVPEDPRLGPRIKAREAEIQAAAAAAAP